MKIKLKSIQKISIISGLGFVSIIMLASLIIKVANRGPVDGSLDEDQRKFAVAEAIQVNVLNACGESGLADNARKYLRMRGFDVVEIGNYKDIIEKSIVIDRIGDIRSSQKVAFTMGINDSLITSQIDSSLYLRSTLVIGKDFKELNGLKWK